MFNKFFSKEKKSTMCVACSCLCDTHKEHTHDKKDSDDSGKKCEMCCHKHKSDGQCDCDCK